MGLALVVSSGAAAFAAVSPNSGPESGGTTVVIDTPSSERFVHVAAGYGHSLGLDADGRVWAWGNNTRGQLGDGDISEYLQIGLPHEEPGLVVGLPETPAVQVAAGGLHSVALLADGTMWAWGADFDGQLGDGTRGESYSNSRPAPVQVTGLPASKIVQIDARMHHTLALAEDGSVWEWGAVPGAANAGTHQLVPTRVAPLPTGIVQVSAGNEFDVALGDDGSVWTWGANSYGQLGDGSATHRLTPVQVKGLPTSIHRVAAGGTHAAVVDGSGHVWAWGSNAAGQLADGSQAVSRVPLRATGLPPERITQLTAGQSSTMVTTDDGTLWTWGDSTHTFPYSGVFNTAPRKVQELGGSAVVEVSSDAHSLVLTIDGQLWGWGENKHGEVGVPPQGPVPNGPTAPIKVGPPQPLVTAVLFDGAPGTDLRRISASQVSVVTPSHTYGLVDITLNLETGRTKALSQITIAEGFEYLPTAPKLTSGQPRPAAQHEDYKHVVTATGTGPLTYDISEGELPVGLRLDATTGVIDGAPTAAGSSVFTVRVTGPGGTDSAEYTLRVEAPVVAEKRTDPGTTTPTTTSPSQSGLASTGLDAAAMWWTAAGAMALGVVGLLLQRRRHKSRS